MPGFKFVDTLADYDQSIKRLKAMTVRAIYPGHGKALPHGYLQRR